MLSSKIKIAFFISHLPKEGPVQVIYNIIENIDFSKFEVCIITFKNESEFSLMGDFTKFPIEIIKLNHTGKFNVLGLFAQLKLVLKSKKIQILHSHCFTSLILSSFLKINIVKFHTIHIYPSIQYIAMKGQIIGGLINLLTKRRLVKIDYPIACSESVQLNFKHNDNIVVGCVQNGVKQSMKPSLSKYEMKMRLNLDPAFNYFISVGRFSKEKNFISLVEQFKLIKSSSYKLIILGSGLQFDEISAQKDDSIILTGFKHNVNDYLFASDYYISSSLTEGMPLSVLEAMSVGLPLILSDIDPHKEIFQKTKNKEIGFIFRSESKEDIILKIEQILKMDYSILCQNVLSVYDQNFSAKSMSNKYQELYLNSVKVDGADRNVL